MKFKLVLEITQAGVHTAGQIADALKQASEKIAPRPYEDVMNPDYSPMSGDLRTSTGDQLGHWKLERSLE